MKTLAALLLLAATAAASAVPMLAPDGTYHAAPPSRLETPDGVATIGNPDALLAYGWAYASPERIAAEEAAQAAAQAEAEAQAALPTVFETGIAVLDADGHHMEFVPIADGEPPLAIQISDSPLDKATRDAKVAAKLAELAAAKAERKALKDRELDDLKAAIASAKNHKELGAAVVRWIEATEPATVEDSK